MRSFLKLNPMAASKSLLALTLLFTIACEEKKEPVEFVAKVENSVLSRTQLNHNLLNDRFKNRHEEEFIRNWIETEVLFQEAVSKNVLSDTLFKEIIKESRRELAATLLLEKYYSENTVNINDDEIGSYYTLNKNDFKVKTDLYRYNLIKFSDELVAIKFRNTLIETDWTRAFNAFADNKSIIYSKENALKQSYELNPQVLYKIISHLYEYETSIIFESEPGVFSIVQLLEKINKNDVPPLSVVKGAVEDRIKMIKRKELYNDLIEDLYSKYNVVINRYGK